MTDIADKKKRNTTVDVIKGFCAFLVVINHSEYSDAFYRYSLFPFWVYAAVPVFMFLSGFIRCRKAPEFKESYSLTFVSKQLSRLLVPFFPVFFIEEFISLKGAFSLKTILIDLMDGGHGPGSYYVILMIQFVFVIPLIQVFIRRYDRKGLWLCSAMNIVYEILKSIVNLSPTIYRVLLFRYLFVIAWGVYYYSHQKENQNRLAITICMIIGLVYIYAVGYMGVTILCFNQWAATAIPASFFWVPIVMLLLKRNQLRCSVLEIAGRASYHIFLIQMFYFRYIYSYLNLHFHYLLMILVNLMICVSAGICFYLFENRIRKMIKNRLSVSIN